MFCIYSFFSYFFSLYLLLKLCLFSSIVLLTVDAILNSVVILYQSISWAAFDYGYWAMSSGLWEEAIIIQQNKEDLKI